MSLFKRFFSAKEKPTFTRKAVVPSKPSTQDLIKQASWEVISRTHDEEVEKLVAAMSPEQREDFSRECKSLLHNEVLQTVVGLVVRKQQEHILKNIEEKVDLLCVRSSVLGVNSINNHLRSFAGSLGRDKDFDPYKPL